MRQSRFHKTEKRERREEGETEKPASREREKLHQHQLFREGEREQLSWHLPKATDAFVSKRDRENEIKRRGDFWGNASYKRKRRIHVNAM